VQTLRLDVEPWPQPLRWALVSKGFELPATFCGDLRYEDPDGDLISMSTDDEVEEALRLCYDGQTLRMTIIAARDSPAAASPQDEAPVGKAWPKPEVLSNVFEDNEAAPPVSSLYSPSSPASVSSALGDFEMVKINSRPDSVHSSAAASQAVAGVPESPGDEEEATQAALEASAEEEDARVAAEMEAWRKMAPGSPEEEEDEGDRHMCLNPGKEAGGEAADTLSCSGGGVAPHRTLRVTFAAQKRGLGRRGLMAGKREKRQQRGAMKAEWRETARKQAVERGAPERKQQEAMKRMQLRGLSEAAHPRRGQTAALALSALCVNLLIHLMCIVPRSGAIMQSSSSVHTRTGPPCYGYAWSAPTLCLYNSGAA